MEQKQAPNQEILVQFSNEGVTPHLAINTIESVQRQLQSIGAKQIQVAKVTNGTIKVRYFSSIDVAIVKALFSSEKNIDFGYANFNDNEEEDSSNFPFEENFYTYHLNVSEIEDSSKRDLGNNGVLVEVKFVRDPYVNPIAYVSTSEKDFSLKKHISTLQNKLYVNSVIFKDNASYKIPEVRAGPLS